MDDPSLCGSFLEDHPDGALSKLRWITLTLVLTALLV